MSVRTTYDEKRDELRNKLNECLKMTREMLDENIWGYEDMKEDYIDNVYFVIKKARDTI